MRSLQIDGITYSISREVGWHFYIDCECGSKSCHYEGLGRTAEGLDSWKKPLSDEGDHTLKVDRNAFVNIPLGPSLGGSKLKIVCDGCGKGAEFDKEGFLELEKRIESEGVEEV